MKIILISAVLLQITYSYAYPASQGVASFAYQDSAGNRYGGTYDLDDKLVQNSDLFTPFNDVSSFFPNYFTNYDNIIQQFPNFGGGFPFFGPGAGLSNMDSSRQAAFASAALGPGFSHQVAAIDPINIDMPNVDMTNRFSDAGGASGKPQYYSVSSSSFASSANDNGKVTGYRGAETVVNNNGKVTKYKVES